MSAPIIADYTHRFRDAFPIDVFDSGERPVQLRKNQSGDGLNSWTFAGVSGFSELAIGVSSTGRNRAEFECDGVFLRARHVGLFPAGNIERPIGVDEMHWPRAYDF